MITIAALLRDLAGVGFDVSFEQVVPTLVRASGAGGARRYAAGQRLTVRIHGVWRDAEVEEATGSRTTHQLLLAGDGNVPVSLELHPWNHALLQLPQADFQALDTWYRETMRIHHAHIVDALSGQQLDTLQQCVAIDVQTDEQEKSAASR